ncbi:MAG: DUF3306 domain-containing protein [Burkholderiales bacterium]
MAGEREDFLRRWSRRKQDAAAAPAPAAQAAPPLPAIDSLTFDSDFKAFMHAKVDAGVRRAALKKLFADPRFNIMDRLDVYIDDYSKDDPIPPAMLAELQRARSKLPGRDPEKAPAEAPALEGETPVAQTPETAAAAETKDDGGAAG